MSLAKNLGFSETTRLLIIHADDAGLAHSQNRAIIQCLESGAVNSYSVMVPCPWFYEIAAFSKTNPRFDCGVHLTLTCEWETYKFGPVLPISEVPSLVDEYGYFYRKREDLRKHAVPEEVAKELGAQIEKALAHGIRPTHIDSHMYSVGACAEFFEIYRNLGKKYALPVLINRQLLEMVGLDPDQNLSQEVFTVDKIHLASYEYFQSGQLSNFYAKAFENMVSGVNVLLIHPAFDDSEMRGITINHPNFGAEWRQVDLDIFSSQETLTQLKDEGITLITWDDIRRTGSITQ